MRLFLGAVWLIFAGAAAADEITEPIEFFDSSGNEMTLDQALDAAGNSVYLLFNLGTDQEWTTPENASLNLNLFDLILELGGNQADIAELFQPGAVFADFESIPAAAVTSSDEMPAGNIPEPATLALLSASLITLGCYAALRIRRLARQEPLQRSG